MFDVRISLSPWLLVSLSVSLGMVLAGSGFAQPPGGDKEYPKEVYFDFRGKPLPPELLLRPDGAERFVRTEPEGLRVTLPKNRDNLEPVKVSTRFGVQGDFEITATVEILQAERLSPGAWGAGAALFLNRAEPANQGASFARVSRPEGKEVVLYDLFGKPGEVDVNSQPCPDKLVRLRLKRSGSQISYLLATGLQGENFEELSPKTFGRDDIQQVTVRVMTGRQPYSVDARLIDLRVRSGRVPATPVAAPTDVPQEPQTGFRWKLWLAAAIVGLVGAAFLGTWLLWRRRDRAGTMDDDAPGPDERATAEAGANTVLFPCSECGKKLKVKAELVGKKVKCTQCGTAVLVPANQAD